MVAVPLLTILPIANSTMRSLYRVYTVDWFLGRSVSHLSILLEDMDKKGVTIRSLVDGLDTSNKSSKMLYHMLSIVSEMERDNIHARVLEGISNAQKFGTKSGKPIGRPKVDRMKIEQAVDLMQQGKSIRVASRRTGIGEATLYRRLAEFRKTTGQVELKESN